MSITIGQTIIVKAGQQDEETGTSLAAWSGRVIDLHPDYGTAEVEWDSPTLLQLPDAYIRHSLDEGYDYLRYFVEIIDVEVIEPRDTPEQVLEIQEELSARYHDYELYGDPSIPFSTVEREAFTANLMLPKDFAGWLTYLEKHLVFPFRAKVVEGYHHIDGELDVFALDGYEDSQGILVLMKWVKREGGHFTLCDLEAVDKDSDNYRLLRKYVIWYANH